MPGCVRIAADGVADQDRVGGVGVERPPGLVADIDRLETSAQDQVERAIEPYGPCVLQPPGGPSGVSGLEMALAAAQR